MNQLLSNQKNGFMKEETQNGFAEGTYENGVKVGQWVLTYPDRKEEGQFKGKKRVGEWIIQNYSDNLQYMGQYDEMNLKTGDWIVKEHQQSQTYLKVSYLRGKKQRGKQLDHMQIYASEIKLD